MSNSTQTKVGPVEKIVALLRYSEQFAKPRMHPLRKWIEPRGTRAVVELWQTNITVRVVKTGDAYQLRWSEKQHFGVEQAYRASLTLTEQGKLHIFSLERRLEGLERHKLLEAFHETADDQTFLAQMLCDWLAL